jgi:hypothetical protein
LRYRDLRRCAFNRALALSSRAIIVSKQGTDIQLTRRGRALNRLAPSFR